MKQFDPYPYSLKEIDDRILEYQQRPLQYFQDEQEAFRFLIQCIDLTSLEGTDNNHSIAELCALAKSMIQRKRGLQGTAAVCVYPPFVSQCKQELKDTSIKVASVAGAFPSGQAPLYLKIREAQYILVEGADEVDMVISRGKFLEKEFHAVSQEIREIRRICENNTLKVILETGELDTIQNIYAASQLAIQAGADFIKTSTGKTRVNATPQSFLVMLDAIASHYEKTGVKVGIKPSGGIADAETAILYLKILENVLGKEWLNRDLFRIGTSRLLMKLVDQLP